MTRRTRPTPRAAARKRLARSAAPAAHPARQPTRPGRTSIRWWHLVWLPAVGAAMALAAAFISLFATSTWIAAAVIWVAFLASLPIAGMAVAIPVVTTLPIRYTSLAAAAAAVAAVPAGFWASGYVLARIDSGPDVLNSPQVLAAAEVWTLAAVLAMAAGLTLVSAAVQAIVDLVARR